VDAELQGRTVLGDRKVGLAPVQRLAGTLLVVVRAKAILGDLRLRSLAPGDSPSRWGSADGAARPAQAAAAPAAGGAGAVPPAAVLAGPAGQFCASLRSKGTAE
jgi:hypothetical protein